MILDRHSPASPLLQTIDGFAFFNAEFVGAFPVINKLDTIGFKAFYYAEFTGAFPALNALETIGNDAFYTSNFEPPTIITLNPAGAIGTTVTLGLVDTSAGAVSATFGGVLTAIKTPN